MRISPRERLSDHVTRLLACDICPGMHKPVVSGGAVRSKVILVGQAPGSREPLAGRPFAWTAGRTLFGWFERFCGIDENRFRSSIYMAAVCRCFPGKTALGGDRVPNPEEIGNCSLWLQAEIEILQPTLVIPVGRLAMSRFLQFEKITDVVGHMFPVNLCEREFDVIPLPHPSGASPWHRMEPGKSLVERAMNLIAVHPGFVASCKR